MLPKKANPDRQDLETGEDDQEFRRATLLLAVTPGVGPIVFRRLVAFCGSPRAALEASERQLRAVEGIGPQTAAAIARQARDRERIVATIEQRMKASEQRYVIESDAEYPVALRETTAPPPLLFVRGQGKANSVATGTIAIVGSRHATRYGLRQAERLAFDRAEAGITIISGLARGIDGAAHRGALAAKGQTIAVLGGGLDRVHPTEHRALADEIRQTGCLVGEHPPGFPPRGGVFPQRNRVIAGMSQGVIVIEAGLRSGALGTVAHALEQNREVFAMPGPVDSPVSRGCHRLLRDGATLVESARDVFDAFGVGSRVAGSAEPALGLVLELNEQERRILEAVDLPHATIDDVIRATELPVSRVLATLATLEARGLIHRHSGGRVSRR